MKATPAKPWFDPPPYRPVKEVIVIGAGIAGASTAYALAKQGIKVTVLEQSQIASGASGNHQGLLYCKISASDTAQNKLLKQAYGFVLQQLQTDFPQAPFWESCGLLQLAFNHAEAKRQQGLIKQGSADFEVWQQQNADLAQRLPDAEGLWWPQGARVSPPLWIKALLAHPLITVHEQCPLAELCPPAANEDWQVVTLKHGVFTASHVVICAGAHSDSLSQASFLQLRRIRGQVAYVSANQHSLNLSAAVTGAHYIIPAFKGIHTFGASFVFNDDNCDFRLSEHQDNIEGLRSVFPELANIAATEMPHGRASIRADSIDHLPIVGPVGKFDDMRRIYHKLSQDKNYPITTACPYWDGLWVNTAHGTRGMLTAPLCAHSLALRMSNQIDELDKSLQDALHPNRLAIRQLIYASTQTTL